MSAGSTIDLAAAGLFVNSGGGSLTPGAGGVWRVWANTWVGETRGGLAPGNPLPNLYGCSFGDVGSCGASGVAIPATNHFLYVQRPTIVAGVGNIVRTYGAANPPLNPTAPTGLQSALGDTWPMRWPAASRLRRRSRRLSGLIRFPGRSPPRPGISSRSAAEA